MKFANACALIAVLGVVLNVKLAKLDNPLDYPSYNLGLVHQLLYRLVRHHQDGVRLEVGAQLA